MFGHVTITTAEYNALVTAANQNNLIVAKLNAIQSTLNSILQGELKMANVLDGITAEVNNAATVEQSALTLIQGLSAQITAAGTDPVKLKALTDQLNASDTALAAAVVANTPAAPVTIAPPSV